MAAVDNVSVRLGEARMALHRELVAKAKARYEKPAFRAYGPNAKYNGSHPAGGRYDWAVKTTDIVEVLIPECDYIVAMAAPDNLGEYMSFFHFSTRVHWQTMRKMLRKHGIGVLYVVGCTMDDSDRAADNCGYNVYMV